MKRVRIVNNGEPSYMTRVTDTETGELLPVTVIEFEMHVAKELPIVRLTMLAPIIDIIADAEIKRVCPSCGRPFQKGEQGVAEGED